MWYVPPLSVLSRRCCWFVFINLRKMARSPPTPCRSVLGRVSLINISLLRQKERSSRRYSPRPKAYLTCVFTSNMPISQKRLNNATPCVTAARRPLLLINAYTPRPVGLLHDAFHRGQSAVLLTVSAQNLFRLRLWNKAHWGGYLAGVRPPRKRRATAIPRRQAKLLPPRASHLCLSEMVGSRHTRREKLKDSHVFF